MIVTRFTPKNGAFLLILIGIIGILTMLFKYSYPHPATAKTELHLPEVEDLIAQVFYNQSGDQSINDAIRDEYKRGLRDDYYLPISYHARMYNTHYNDIKLKDEFQKVRFCAQVDHLKDGSTC